MTRRTSVLFLPALAVAVAVAALAGLPALDAHMPVPAAYAEQPDNGDCAPDSVDCIFRFTDTPVVERPEAGPGGGSRLIEVDPVHNRIYIAYENMVAAYNAGRQGYPLLYNATFPGAAGNPIEDMAVDTRTGNLYVATDFGSSTQLYRWNPSDSTMANVTLAPPRYHDGARQDPVPEALHVDSERGLVYISTSQHGILVVNATADPPEFLPYGWTAPGSTGWRETYYAWYVSSMAVNSSSIQNTTAYAMAMYWDNAASKFTMGLNTLEFDGSSSGSLNPNYTAIDNIILSTGSNGLIRYNTNVTALDMVLDDRHDKLFVLFSNYTLGWYDLTNRTRGATGLPTPGGLLEKTSGFSGDLALDERRGLLYWATSTNVGVYRTSDGERLAVIDRPSYTGGSIAIDSVAGSAAVPAGMDAGDLDSGIVYALGLAGPSLTVIDPRPESLPERLAREVPAGGGVVAIPDGTYRDVYLTTNAGGSERAMTIRPESGRPGGVVFTGASHILVRNSDVAVQGIVFKDTTCHDKVASVDKTNGYLSEYVINVGVHTSRDRNITIANNVFDNTCYGGILSGGAIRSTSGSASDVLIANNTFRDIGYNARHYDGVPEEPRSAITTGAYSRAVQMRNAEISSNMFDKVAGIAVDVRQARSVDVSGNTFADIPHSAVRVMGGSDGVAVANNSITNASYAPNYDFLRGVEGSANLTQDAAILVVPDDGGRLGRTDNVNVTGNNVSESGGAFSVCGAVCGGDGRTGYAETWGSDVDSLVGPAGQGIRFNWNIVYESNGERLVENGVRGALDARYNYYPGYEPAAGVFAAGTPASGQKPAGSVLYEPLFTLAPDYAAAPSVLRVTSDNASTGYVEGQSIDIRVVFTKPVAISAGAAPILTIHAGQVDRDLDLWRHDASVLVFRYTIAGTDSSAALDYKNETSLSIRGGGDITDMNTGTAANLTLPEPGSDASLASQEMVIGTPDTTAPNVQSVTSRSVDGTYGLNELVEVQVAFDETVYVDTAKGSPTLVLETGETDRHAVYARGSGTHTLVFAYYPTHGDMSGDLDYAGTGALMLNGGTIRDVVRNNANLTLPDPGSNASLAGSKNIKVMVPMLVGNGACGSPADCSYSATGAFALPPGLVGPVETGTRLAAMDTTRDMLYVVLPGSPPVVSILRAADGFSEVETHTFGDNDTYVLDIAANTRDGTAYVLAHDTAGTNDWQSPWYHRSATQIDDDVFILTINATGHLLSDDRTDLKITGRNGSETSPRPDDALVVDADGQRLYAATLDGIVTVEIGPGGMLADKSALVAANTTDEQGTRISAMAVDTESRIAYAAAAYVLPDDNDNRTADMTYGLMAFNFTGSDGMFTPNYTRAGSLDIHANPSILPADAGSFAAGDIALDVDGGRLYVAWFNGTVSSYMVSAASPAPALDRHFEESEWGVVDIEIDASSGLLYAVTMPRDGTQLGLVAYNATAGTIAGRVDVPAAGSGTAAAAGGSLYGRAGLAVVASAVGYGPVHVVPGSGGTAYTVDPKPMSIPELLVAAAVPGSTVVIPDGTYRDVDLSLGEKSLSLRSATGQPGGVVFTGVSHLLVRDGGSTVEGMTFRNIGCAVYDYVVEVSTWSSVDADIAIRNNVLDGTCPGGIDIGGARDGRAERITVENNTFSGIGTYPPSMPAAPAVPRAAIHTGQAPESVQVRDAAFLSNRIDTTSGTGIEIGQGRNVTVAGNDIRSTPGSAIVIGGGSDGVAITGNYIAGANSEPDFDYLSGVSGSLAAVYEAAILVKPGDGGALGPTDNVLASGNTISASTGAFSVCGDVCEIRGGAYDAQWGPGAANHVIGLPGGQDIRFSDNTVHENNTGVLVRNDALGVLDARYNEYPGYVPNASRFDPPSRVAWDLGPTTPSTDARFAGPNTVVVNYTGPLGPPAGYDDEVYGMATGPGGLAASVASVAGLGTATHTVLLDGAGADTAQTAEIAVNTRMEGTGPYHTRYAFEAASISVGAAGAAATVSTPAGREPIVEITPESFVREVDVTAAGEAVRATINVTALSRAPLAPDAAANVVQFPPEDVTIRASFAEVTVPANTTATSIPADGLIRLYVSDNPPALEDVAAALGHDSALVVIGRVVEAGDDAAHIAFDMPVRILLIDHAGSEAFYVNNTGGAVAPIDRECAADDADAVHAQLGGSGECQIDSGDDKAVHTYHLTQFGAAWADEGVPMRPDAEVPVQPETYPVTALVNMTARAAEGGTVAVPPGEYGEDVLVVNKSLTIEPADPSNPPVFTGYSHIVVRPAEADGPIVIRGISFMNTTHTPGGRSPALITIESAAGGQPANATTQPVVVEGSTFSGTCGTAIRAAADMGAPPIAGLEIRGNSFYAIGANANSSACPLPAGAADAIAAGGMPQGGGLFQGGAAAQLRGLSISDNHIFGATHAGIRVGGADGLAILDNHIEGAASDGIRILPSRDAAVRGNTIVGANNAPGMQGGHAAAGAAGAAIEVWSGSDDVAVTLNRISGSAGAFYVCAGTCDPGGGADPVRAAALPVGSPDGAGGDIRFNHNVIAASNTGAPIANGAGGMLNARSNYYPGHAHLQSLAARAADVAPALDGAGPVRIGAIVADGAGSPVRSAEEAVRAAFELGVRDFNAMQAAVGGFVGLEPVVQTVQSPGYAPSARAGHAAALAALDSGAGDDARMLPVLHNSISSAMAMYDGSGADALDAISAMGATHGHYPFVNARNGTIVAHGANLSLVGDSQTVRALAGGTDGALAALFDFSSAERGVEPGHPSAPWKWWAYDFADPSSAAGETRSKRSAIALHPGPDGALHSGDDLVFGAGYYPHGPPSHLVVSAGDAPAAANASGGAVIVAPASTAAQLAAPDMMFRLAPPDRMLAGVVLDAATRAQAAGGRASAVIALNDSASLQSISLAGELDRIDGEGALPSPLDRGRGVAVVSYNSSEPGWAAGAAAAIAGAAAEQRSGSTAVVYSGRAGAFADLAAAFGPGGGGNASAGAQPPARTAWYATGELGRAELAAAGPAAESFARAASLAVVLQHAEPDAAVDAALAAPSALGAAPDASTRGPAYAAYDAAGLLGRAITSTAEVQGPPDEVAKAIMDGVARTHDGALAGSLILDGNGDLVLPVRYALSSFPAAPGGEWEEAAQLEGERTCGILLEKSVLDFGILAPGQRSRIATQTVINSGTLPYSDVALVATAWTYAGTGATLPASLTELRELGQAASFADLRPGQEVASGLDPGTESKIQYRLDLTGLADLRAGEISQTVNYSVECTSGSG